MRSLQLQVADATTTISPSPKRLVIAGYTARDTEATQAHISELAAIGIPPPPSVPAFYELDPSLVTTGTDIAVTGAATSGEVEPVIIRHDDRYYLGVGSDHTDRDAEREDIAGSKACCAKPLSPQVIALGEGPGHAAWDRIQVRSHVDGQLYQSGTLSALICPEDLMGRLEKEVGDTGGDLVVFGGTLPLLHGSFLPGQRWTVALSSKTTTLTCSYNVHRRSC